MTASESKESRRCSVCKAPTEGNFLGIEACRACSIFYRRSFSSKNKYTCRTGQDDCQLDREFRWSCKKCRFRRIQEEIYGALGGSRTGSGSTSTEQQRTDQVRDELPSMEVGPTLRLFRSCYNDVCRQRLIIEFGSLDNLPIDENGLVAVAHTFTCGSLPVMKLMYDSLHCFLEAASDDYAVMRPDYQNLLCANFARHWSSFECCYRSWKHFPNNGKRVFVSYSRCLDIDDMHMFYADFPGIAYKEDAIRLAEENSANNLTMWLPAIKRLKPSDEEFIAITAFLLWNIGGADYPDPLLQIAGRNKATILHELHDFYKSQGIYNYAARLGEIFMFLSILEGMIRSWTELMGVFKMLDVIDEETYNFANLSLE